MLMFPYAKDLHYKDKELSFTIQFVEDNNTVDVNVAVIVDDEFSNMIEDLLDKEIWWE